MMKTELAAFILTNGRPDNVITYKTLKDLGFNGDIYIIVDNQDRTIDKYRKNFGENVKVFDKKAIARKFDTADNFDDMRAIVYARNACFEIAKELDIRYFIQLDDDYTSFRYRFDSNYNYYTKIKPVNLTKILNHCLDYFKSATRIHSLCIAQGGDYIGGEKASVCFGKGRVGMRRKAMNSFICSTDRFFQFVGRINEDVNTYTYCQSTGLLFFTLNQFALEQKQTQSNEGGMTEMYLDSGTYVKSFYSVMFQPSSVKITMMGFKNKRLHHKVDWDCTTPMILNEKYKKAVNNDHKKENYKKENRI